jgi:hypothetical protein
MTILDEDNLVKDGGSIRVPLFTMDAVQRVVAARKPSASGHKPGSLPVTDAERTTRAALYDAADKRLSDRWKNPPPVVTTKAQPTTDLAQAYARRDKALSDRWRS